MKMKIVSPLAVGAVLLLQASTVSAGVPTPSSQGMPRSAPQAQRLVDGLVSANPDMLDVLMHVTPPGKSANIVIAAHLRHAVGEASGSDDLGVVTSGKPLVEVQKDGIRIGVLVPLHDHTGRSIGALGLMYPYHGGDDQAAVLRRSFRLRDTLARAIPSRASLFI